MPSLAMHRLQDAITFAVRPRVSATNSDQLVGKVEFSPNDDDHKLDRELLARAESEAKRQGKTLRKYLKEAVEEKIWRDWPKGRS